jgi:flagellar biosynthesis protein FlhF
LIWHGVDQELAEEWTQGLDAGEIAGEELEAGRSSLLRRLRARIKVEGSLEGETTSNKPTLLVGPTGAGKTTTLLKLALEFGIRRGRPTEIWSLDGRSDTAEPKVQSFADALSIPIRKFRSARSMAAASLENASTTAQLVLVDTKGVGSGSVDVDSEPSSILGGSSRFNCHLVLPVVWQQKAIARVVDRFEVFQPSRLLFTNWDQACAYGAILQEPWRTAKPLSLICDGPLGAGTISPASLQKIVEAVTQPTE